MEYNEQDISPLIEKYEQAKALGMKLYLDADEFMLLSSYYNSGGDEEEAEFLIDEGLRIHPGNQELMLMKARILLDTEYYDDASYYLERLADEDSDEFPMLKIESLFLLGRIDEGHELIDKSLESGMNKDDYYVFITEMGFLLADMGEYERAIELLEESVKLYPTNKDALIELSFAYEMTFNYGKAIKYNNKLLDMDPYSYDGWVNLGKLYSINEQHDKAIDAFDFALAVNDEDKELLKMKAMSMLLNENVAEAVALFEDCLILMPNDETVYDSLLEGYAAMDRFDDMMRLIDQKEAILGSEGILIKRVLVYVHKDDYETANELFSQIPEEERESLEYFMLEAELAFEANDFARAESAYMKAALISKDNTDIIDRLVNISVAQEKYEQAADYLEELLVIDPNYPTAKSRLAFIRFEIGCKEPFDEIMEQFSDDELRSLLRLIMGNRDDDLSDYDREKILFRLNEARENRVLFKNIKY